MTKAVHPFQGGGRDGFQGTPRSAAANNLGLSMAVNRFGEGIDGLIQPRSVSGLQPTFAASELIVAHSKTHSVAGRCRHREVSSTEGDAKNGTKVLNPFNLRCQPYATRP
ncbi:hypothetical protein HUE56_07855 (plasmid) [Azospirillum oryzae]|uniref:Uncharacterized protein n=1 Tax=Azospirillum oryzae TaxID=286727 RepID=A0A6N1AJA8_9PROT|nr:hypothetical protein FZ938_18775 [Azospirillum oryzae]QKS50447.1 hypothetical protein HUE56_07855 [Azospirillum oryzae]